nr:tegument protein UL37 [Mastomys natalensis cytomegalovirus 3]WEG70022.1 tegument protein UL37 [Mastomys natalensis cytomegalovirus 3]WEG70162.1 tegument protein UL37 [Mastomys natalensis cytomegalovirus 3]WEG70722.1 tegument protein UL37 [Mastomys natalensis cytomegalovirus 3]
MALSKGPQHATRSLNLEQTLEDLRIKTTSDGDLLNILAKIEISAVQLQTLTVSRIRRFIQHVPESGYHFEFIRKNSVFYLLNHGTFAPVEKGRFPLTQDLMIELKKYVDKSPEDKTSKLCNDHVIQLTTQFLNDANRIVESHKHITINCLIDDETTRHKTRIKEFEDTDVKIIEKAISSISLLRNCRAIAELLEELHRIVLETFRSSFTYKSFKNTDDTLLDIVIKIIHCSDNHSTTPESETEFNKAIDRATNILANVCTTDIYDIQQPGSEYTKDISFKISSKSLLAKERPDLRFPILIPSMSVLKHISPKNVLFYPGVIFAILREATREQSTSYTDELNSINDFFSAVNDMLFSHVQDTRHRTVTLHELLDRTKTFYQLGLTEKTTTTYIRMISMRSTYRPEIRTEISEAVDHITFLVYNAHMHFLCLARYSNTFLFQHAKRLIMEQQRSLLTGNKSLEDVWANVAFNINRTFAMKYDEDEFLILTSGISPASKEYLYRDAVNKWDDITFSLDQDDITDPLPLPPQQDPSPEDIMRACELITDSEAHSYNSLLPLSTYPEFDRILVQTTIIPQLHDIINAPPSDIRDPDDMRLLKLIHLCRLLIPRRIELYRNLVSLYNLLHYVSQTDIGLVKVIYNVIRNVINNIRDITGDSYAFNSDMLEDMAIDSFMSTIKYDIAHTMTKLMKIKESLIDRYIDHSRTCHILLQSTATIYTNTNTVVITDAKSILFAMPFPEFIARLRKIISNNIELEDELKFVTDSDISLLHRLRAIADEARSIPIFNDLTFSTRPISRLYIKLSDSIQTNQTYLQSLYSDRFGFNRSVCDILSSIISSYQTLQPDRIKQHGLRQCVADAVALIESHKHFVGTISKEEFDQDSITILKKTFETHETHNPSLKRREMTSHIHDGDVVTNFNYNSERYVSTCSPSTIRDWYVEKLDKICEDLTTPLRLSKVVPTSS